MPQSPSSSSSEEVLTQAQLQSRLEERARHYADRQQQTQQAHQGLLSNTSTPTIVRRIFDLGTPSLPSTPAMQQQTPQGVPEYVIGGGSESEEEMLTARGETMPTTPRSINYSTNIASMSANDLKFQLFLRGVDISEVPSRIKGKGGGKTEKQYYANIANEMIKNGSWQTRIEEQLLRSRIANFRRMHQSRGSRD